MRYQYYPGCSLEGTALEYNLSTRAVMDFLGVELLEIEAWTCCGASAADAVSALLSLALPARNLALAEKRWDVTDVLVPCSACYLNLKKVEEKTKQAPELHRKLNEILAVDQLEFSGQMHVRHLLDVIVNDIGASAIYDKAGPRLQGLRFAAYYGCQCLRPYAVFDDPEAPQTMDALIHAAGAHVHSWRMAGKCCGASHMSTKMDVGLKLVAAILQGARGADAIITVCPMCQMNLEAFQQKISRQQHADLSISVLYLPQFLGLALGLSAQQLRLDLNLSLTDGFRRKLGV
jgi:heterodisulfide reductase subunit B